MSGASGQRSKPLAFQHSSTHHQACGLSLGDNFWTHTRAVRAREKQADFYADEIIGIADDESLDPNSRRIMIDARKWAASRLRPKVYGDKLVVGGADDLPAIRTEMAESADAFTSGIAGLAARSAAGRAIKH